MEAWIAETVGKMHVHKIKQTEVAKELGFTVEYVNMILNGKRTPSGAKDMITSAVDKLVDRKIG